MSDAIDRAARALWDYDNADSSAEWRDMAWDDMGGSEPSEERVEYELRARALAEAGWLAPAPLREVTTAEELDALITMRGTVVLDCDGNAWQSCSQCSPLWPDANIWMSAITSAYNSRTSDVLGQVAPLTVLHVPADAVNRAEADR